ncbi:MAG TPA: penicillin-binding transpeptidase domain-containing protein [Polyangiaceae bacterium]|nr:penicillin-binding transpeptidase domain-containing protein [Polyangiaceae bacterium]
MSSIRIPLVLASLLLTLAAGAADAAPRAIRRAPSSASAPRAPALRPSTLDDELEQAAQRLLRSAKPVEGAVVMVEPKSGRVLAFSALSGAANRFELLTKSRLPAASLFKIVTATALFESTTLSPRDEVCIQGGMRGIERRHLEPARGPGTECGRFAWALGHSKNAVFAQLATRLLTRDDLLRTAERLGFNSHLALDDGQRQVELGRLTVPYSDLAFARTAAGFQGSSLSPIGAAYLMTVIARGGSPVGLRLHDSVAETEPSPPTPNPSPLFSARTAQRLTRMLEVTVETGTSRGAFTSPEGKRYLPGIRVAGKTGTLSPGQGQESTTSWFVGFAPSRSPEVVVSVMLVNGRLYRRKANEVARDLLRTYFRSHGRAHAVTDPFEDAPGAGVAALAASPAR